MIHANGKNYGPLKHKGQIYFRDPFREHRWVSRENLDTDQKAALLDKLVSGRYISGKFEGNLIGDPD